MHLTGKADACDFFWFCICLLQRFLHRRAASAPPIQRILFRPAVLWRGKSCVFLRSAGGDAAAFVN